MNINLFQEGMHVEANAVRRKQLSQYLDQELLKRERRNSEAATAPSLIAAARKRVSPEPAQTPANLQPVAKRTRMSE